MHATSKSIVEEKLYILFLQKEKLLYNLVAEVTLLVTYITRECVWLNDKNLPYD
jgi:hypothetical protein